MPSSNTFLWVFTMNTPGDLRWFHTLLKIEEYFALLEPGENNQISEYKSPRKQKKPVFSKEYRFPLFGGAGGI
jgi:hypothetical protein